MSVYFRGPDGSLRESCAISVTSLGVRYLNWMERANCVSRISKQRSEGELKQAANSQNALSFAGVPPGAG